jgi:hypothetical protein
MPDRSTCTIRSGLIRIEGIADRLEVGSMVVAEKQPDGTLVDSSPATLAQIKSSLTSLDRLLSELGTSPAQ